MPPARRSHRWLCTVTFAVFLGTAAFVGVAALMLTAPPELAEAEGKPIVLVPHELIRYDDGDTITIAWPGKDPENVRILGIDTPEVMHLEHDLPYAQPFGHEAAGFLRGCIAASEKVELLRAATKDTYGRTLGYILVDRKNFSVLVIEARLAYGPNPKYGDNGLPDEYAACVRAAKDAGPPAFEKPWLYRRRMREVSAYMKKQGTYPTAPAAEAKKTKK